MDMRLYKLIGLEIEALMKENEETNANIYKYEDILERRDSMAQVIIQELDALKKEYARKRRTHIENAEEAVYEEKKPEDVEIMFLMDNSATVRQLTWQPLSAIRRRHLLSLICGQMQKYRQNLSFYQQRTASYHKSDRYSVWKIPGQRTSC